MKKHLSTMVLLNVVLVISMILSACGAGLPAVAPPQENKAPVSNSADVGEAQMTSALVATPAPMAPVVASISPARGEAQPLDAPVTITFDQAMDPASTQAAFEITPQTAGEVNVSGRELVFRPGDAFDRAADYTITIANTAKSAAGLALAAPVVQDFRTVGFIEVASTQPADGSTDVIVRSPITVAFDHPIVPLTGVSGQAGLPQPLVISPEVEGTGEWLNTGIYQFTPKDGLAASTTYSVTVKAGLTDTQGAVLDKDVVISFRTTDPTVVAWLPENNINLPIQSPITVTFSMPMDRASTEAAFSLRDDAGDAVEGTVTWRAGDTVMGFKPSKNLDYDQRYTAEVALSAMAANQMGTLRDASDRKRGFLTVSLPQIVRTDPADGNLKADPMGGITFYFKSPMNPGSFITDSLTILPKPTRVYTNYNPYDNALWVDFNKLPATSYKVTLSGKVADPYGNTLGDDAVVTFRTRDYDPILEINTPAQIGTYNAYTDTEAVVTYRNVPEIKFSLYSTRLDDFLAMTSTGWWEAWDRYAPQKDDLIREWTETTTARPNRLAVIRAPLTDENGAQLAPGFYYLELNGGAKTNAKNISTTRRLLARTDLNIVLKTGQDEALAWVTDLKSGQPVPGAEVRFYTKDKIDAVLTTDADGLAHLTDMKSRQSWEPLAAIATTDAGGFGVTSSDWTNGISPWDFGLSGGISGQPYNAYLYTDRPIYRPGQTVYWKGIVRRDHDAQYTLPDAGQAVTITINDDRGNVVIEQVMTLTPQGTVDGELTLAPDATTGYYYMTARLNEDISFGVGFQVAEYRKPEYELIATTDKPEYVQGEQINVTAQASYFFGGPVKDADVKWVLLTADQYFAPPGKEGYSFTDWNWYDDGQSTYGGELSRGEGKTDKEGRFTFSVPADISKYKQGQRFTFDITITDANNQPVSTQATALVHKGEFYIGLKPTEYVATVGQPAQMDVITVDPQGMPVANTEVTLVVNQVEWLSVREEAEDGRFYWVTRPKMTAIMTDTVHTNFAGEAVMEWTPQQAGDHKIEATARDRAGHSIRSAAWVWVTGPDYVAWRQENNDRIQLIPDRDAYEVGDTARVLVASPYQGKVKALLTVERGSIIEDSVIELAGNSQVLELPVGAEFAPNAYVSLVIVKGMDATTPNPSFRAGLAELKVSVADKELQVKATPQTTETTSSGAPQAGPRDTVTYDIQTLDSEGNPVSADVSLALVDKAVLTLADDQAGTLMNRFYTERPNGIQTSVTLVANVDRLVAQVPEGGKGGGGGGGMGPEGLTIRSEFLDLAFWQASAKTGADGKASVEVTLPDNLTTWTMDARAASPQTLVGQSKSDLIATQPLLIRPTLPRFFVDGDRAEIGGIIQNNTDQPLTVSATLKAEGLEIGAAAQTETTIPANGSRKLTWPVTVDTDGETVVVTLTARASTGGLTDAVEITLPVYRYSTPEVVGTSGQVGPGETRLESILVPENAEPDRGGLDVVIEPSLAAGMRGSLSYLEHYPYECVEQTMSRFLPNVATYLALNELGIVRPGLKAQLEQEVSVGLQKIYTKQHIDGGWGWWQTDDSSVVVSAYVIFGLAKAREAGFAVDPTVLNRGTQYLQQNLKSPESLSSSQANQQAFAVYALAEAGVKEPNRAGALYEQREKLSLFAEAYLALALDKIGDDASAARVQTLLDDLNAAAITSATSTHWEEDFVDYRSMNTDVRTTAIVLDAIAKLDPKNPLAPNAVRWLMSARQTDHWETTQESVWSILGLTDWMAASGELEGAYTWTAQLNGAELGTDVVTPATVGETTLLQATMTDLLRDRANALELARGEGPGQMYYTAFLRTYLPVADLEALDRGMTVSRHYRMADCGQPQGESCPPITTAKVGDIVDVVVDITVPSTMHYLIVEDPRPAGLEPIDTSLRTTSAALEGPQMEATDAAQPGWWWAPTAVDLRDEQTALFATELAPGSYRFTYQARATLPGEYLTLPPTGYQMYFPEVWGRGAGSTFTVTN